MTKKRKRLYRQINVWQRINKGRIAIYRCFEILPPGKYCVQSKDFFSVPIDDEEWRRSERQFLELLSEMVPGGYSYDTLEDALRRFDEDFAWAYALEKAGGFK